MTYGKCKRHDRYSCWDYQCKAAEDVTTNNFGRIGVDLQGDLSMGIGGGMAMDLSDGSLGMKIGGITFDFDGK